MERILVINGPNLNLLGTREPEIYGSTTLSELEALVIDWGSDRGVEVSCYQSNHEGKIIDRLHSARGVYDGLIINAGAFTHYSYAIHDAIVAIEVPAVEVHISNIRARETWRRESVLAAACAYTIYGRGIDGYRSAIEYLVNRAAGPAETISYGQTDDQLADLRVPAGDGPHPVAVLIHGGFWRDQWTRDIMGGIAIDLTRRGWATWNLEYHRVGSGGGWPATLEDVAAGIDHLEVLADDHALDLTRVISIGHSAGGHLALWAAVRPHLAAGIPDPTTRVAVAGTVALAPVTDLVGGFEAALGDGAVEAFLRRTPNDGMDRYEATSPAEMLPLGVPQVIVHGTSDEAVPVTMSRAYVEAAVTAGDSVVYRELDGVDHISLIDTEHPAWTVVVADLDRLR